MLSCSRQEPLGCILLPQKEADEQPLLREVLQQIFQGRDSQHRQNRVMKLLGKNEPPPLGEEANLLAMRM